MKKYFRRYLILLIVFLVATSAFFASIAFSSEDKDEIFTFMQLRKFVNKKPNSPEAQEALFGIAEYFFKQNAILDSKCSFKQLVETKEARIVSFLANVYLYKIAEIKKEEESMLLLKNKIFSNPFILLFSEYKILEYESTMSNKYVIHNYR